MNITSSSPCGSGGETRKDGLGLTVAPRVSSWCAVASLWFWQLSVPDRTSTYTISPVWGCVWWMCGSVGVIVWGQRCVRERKTDNKPNLPASGLGSTGWVQRSSSYPLIHPSSPSSCSALMESSSELSITCGRVVCEFAVSLISSNSYHSWKWNPARLLKTVCP